METGFIATQGLGPSSAPGREGFFSGFPHLPERRGCLLEYLLVVQPDNRVRSIIMAEKQYFSEVYGVDSGIAGVHIPVAVFLAREEMEETLVRWIARICIRQPAFTITLNNYSGIPLHTVCLRVQDAEPFREMSRQLTVVDEFIRSSACPPAALITRPYLSIAGHLDEEVYRRAMPDYSRKTFHESFRVEALVLLKRDHLWEPGKTVQVFGLAPPGRQPFPADA